MNCSGLVSILQPCTSRTAIRSASSLGNVSFIGFTELSWGDEALGMPCARPGGILVSARQSGNDHWMKQHLHGAKATFERTDFDVDVVSARDWCVGLLQSRIETHVTRIRPRCCARELVRLRVIPAVRPEGLTSSPVGLTDPAHLRHLARVLD